MLSEGYFMSIRIVSAALAVVFLTGTLASDAFADHRRRPRVHVYDDYYAGPDVVRVPDVMRFMFGGYRMTPEDYDDLYANGEQEFDSGYYDPQVDQPVKKAKPRKPAKAAVKPKPDLTTASTSKPKAPSAAKSILTCDKASAVVGSYGFTGIKASDCNGEVYAFTATRDGKPFAVKLSALSGELTEVKKLQ